MKNKKSKIEKQKTPRKKINKKKLLITLSIFFVIGTIITISALYLVERYVISLSGTDTHAEEKANKEEKGIRSINISKNAKDIQYSFDNKYYTYSYC